MKPTISVQPTTPYHELPEWLTVWELASYLGVSPWSIYNHVHQGNIPYRRFGKKIIQIPKQYVHPDTAAQQVG